MAEQPVEQQRMEQPEQEQQPEREPLNFLQKCLLYLGIALAVVFCVIAVKAMHWSPSKPSDLLQDDFDAENYEWELWDE